MSDKPPALPCIVCDAPIECCDRPPHDSVTQPYAGTNFTSYGHYGSTFFDPMDGEYVSLNICDPCLNAKAESHLVIGRTSRPVQAWCWAPEADLPSGRKREAGFFRSIVGWERVEAEEMPFTKGGEDRGDMRLLTVEELRQLARNEELEGVSLNVDAQPLLADIETHWEHALDLPGATEATP